MTRLRSSVSLSRVSRSIIRPIAGPRQRPRLRSTPVDTGGGENGFVLLLAAAIVADLTSIATGVAILLGGSAVLGAAVRARAWQRVRR
jgi:hypothetical protein